MDWHLRDRTLTIGPRPLVMGIVNVTPDSFSDGGRHFDPDAALAHGLKLVAEGADLLDIGGESTRPGATPVPLDEELARVVPVIRALASRVSVPLSIDTMKAEVARQCVAAGASIVNDVAAGLADPDMLNVVRDSGAGYVLMHMQGDPRTMQHDPNYADVCREVRTFLADRIAACVSAGIAAERLAVDPGIGFGKRFEHTMEQLRGLPELLTLGRPILLGVSRKGFLGEITGRPRDGRLAGSLAVAVHAATRGAAHIIRVHDVPETVDAMKVVEAIAAPPIL